MAIRFTASSSQVYSSTAGLPTTRLWTITAWVYPVTSPTVGVYITIDGSTGDYAYLGVNTGVLVYDWNAGGSSVTQGGSISTGTWYKVAIVVDGTAATLYQGTAVATSLTSYSEGANFPMPAGTLTFKLGGSPNAAFYGNCRLAAVKMWDAALTSAELHRELRVYVPLRTANLNRWHPLVVSEATDYSGLGRTLSGGSGTSTEAGPPIAWAPSPPVHVITPWTAPITAVGSPPFRRAPRGALLQF